MKNLSVSPFILMMVLIAGCTRSSTENSVQPVGLSSSFTDLISPNSTLLKNEAAPISFAEVNEKVFMRRCQVCHENLRRPTLVTYADYKSKIAAIEENVLDTKEMPPRRQLTDEQLSLVRAWIDQGAPEFVDGPQAPTTTTTLPATPQTGAEPLPVTWLTLKKDVFEPKCLACHFAGNTHGLSSYEDYETVKETITTIYFASVITPSMPPPPNGTPEDSININQLSITEKRKISEWIVQGFPEK